MDDKRIRRKVPLLDEEEQERRDRLDRLDGADWLKADLVAVYESGHIQRRYYGGGEVDVSPNAAVEHGRQWTKEELEGIAQDPPWVRGGVPIVRGSHDDTEGAPKAQPVEGGIAGTLELTAHWIGAPALPTAPRIGEAVIGLFCNPAFREAVLGDLAERFEARAARDGARSARAWYWWQVARSFGAFGWRWGQRLVQLQAVLRLIGF